MNSKSMEKWSGIFLILAVITIIYELFAPTSSFGVFFCLIMGTIYNIGASIMKKLEEIMKNIEEIKWKQ